MSDQYIPGTCNIGKAEIARRKRVAAIGGASTIFGAISIINIPYENKADIIHRYGSNGFRLYKLPILKTNTVIGFPPIEALSSSRYGTAHSVGQLDPLSAPAAIATCLPFPVPNADILLEHDCF